MKRSRDLKYWSAWVVAIIVGIGLIFLVSMTLMKVYERAEAEEKFFSGQMDPIRVDEVDAWSRIYSACLSGGSRWPCAKVADDGVRLIRERVMTDVGD